MAKGGNFLKVIFLWPQGHGGKYPILIRN